jgi:acyl-coenzyme A thioesterase PaaI-like protein
VSARLPEGFRARFDALEELEHNAAPDDAYFRCFGCGPGHPGGVHGGIVGAYLDEILGGAFVRATGELGVTGELTVRYLGPTPAETLLLGRGRMVTDHGKYVDMEGSLEVLESGRVVATARGRFFRVRKGSRDNA